MLKNSVYNLSGGIARILISLVTVPILIRLIGLEEYGLWTLASAIVGVVTVAEAGLAISTTVFASRDLVAEDNAGLSQTLTVVLGAMFTLATAAALALWFGAHGLVELYPNLSLEQQASATLALQVGAIVVWARLVQQVLVGVAQAFQRYGTLNSLNTAQTFLVNGGLVGIAWFGGRTIAMMWWTAIVSMLMLGAYIVLTSWLLRGRTIGVLWNGQRARELGHYSAITWFGSLGGVLFAQGDRLIVGAVLGPAALGVYATITTVTVQINFLSALPVQPLLPAISATSVASERARLIRDIQHAFQIAATIALGLGLSLVALAPNVLQVLLGSSPTSEQVTAFCAAAVIYALYSLNAVGYYMLLGAGKVAISTIVILMSGITALILIWIGVNTLGLLGAVLGNSGYLGTLLLNVLALRHWRINSFTWVRWMLVPLLWFALMIPATLFLPRQPMIAASALALQLAVLIAWFAHTQRESLAPLIRRISQATIRS